MEDSQRGYTFNISVPCNGGSSAFTFTGAVYPGTYRVSVIGGLSNLPQGTPYIANQALTVSGNLSNLTLNVQAHTVSGVVTLNGSQPTSTCSSADRATVRFEDASRGYTFNIAVPCNGGTTPFTFNGSVYPGDYRVSVIGGLSNLPQGTPFIANQALTVSGNVSNLTLNVQSFTVSGVVTLNGAQPTSTCSSADRATVRMEDSQRGYTFNIPVPCNGGSSVFTFTGAVYPGTYRVSVIGGLSNLPQGTPYIANQALTVSGNLSNVTLNVQAISIAGTVTLNGAQPTSTCSSADRAIVRFEDASRGYTFNISVPCNGGSSAFTFSGSVYPGTYRVSVIGGLSNLPQGTPYMAIAALAVP